MFHNRRGLISAVRRPLVAAAPSGGAFPFDVYGAALWWAGLRAYSSTTAGSAPSLRLLKTSDGTTQGNIGTNATTGALNTGDSFFTDGPPSGTLYSVLRVYDQLGSGNDLEMGVGSASPYYLVLDGGLPSLELVSDNGFMELTDAAISSGMPYTISWVGMGTGITMQAYSDSTATLRVGFNNGDVANIAYAVDGYGEIVTIAAADNVFHACQFEATGDDNGTIYVDGASVTNLYYHDQVLGGLVTVGGPEGSKWRESGAWAGSKLSSFAAMNAQQHAVWTDIP
jgi:hypothetical protein